VPFRTILATDDSKGILETLASLFGPPSYRVVNAPNGKDALTLARPSRPDIIITDVILHALDGIEFVRELRHDAVLGRTPVILWSAGYQPYQINGFANGCEPFIALGTSPSFERSMRSTLKTPGAKKCPRRSRRVFKRPRYLRCAAATTASTTCSKARTSVLTTMS
jgi:CheY-like chemotaxis protein